MTLRLIKRNTRRRQRSSRQEENDENPRQRLHAQILVLKLMRRHKEIGKIVRFVPKEECGIGRARTPVLS
jgi:hypothetical protein